MRDGLVASETRTRVDDQTVIEALLFLDESDRAELHGYEGGDDPVRCRLFIVGKRANG